MDKKNVRLRRALKTRSKMRDLGVMRLTVHRTPRHIYAQIIAPAGDAILVTASSLDEEFKSSGKNGGNVAAAKQVGNLIAKRAHKAGIKRVAFDRSGFKYHGRIKALADAARESGMEF